MAKDVTIRVIAKDEASGTFRTIGQNATAATTQIEAGNQRAGRSFQEMQAKATAVGAAVGTLIGGMSLAGQSFVNQENQIRSLNRAYGDASADMQKFAKNLQDVSTFSDDAARKAELTTATLVRNYGFTAQEAQRVLTISADLAATTGFGLEDATQRVTAALRGEAESAEALGLTMNQQAIDRKNLTLTMSNEEAAHFRLNALLEQSAFAEGAAAEAAATNAGKAKQLKNEIQDLTQQFGGALGPMGEFLSVLGQMSLAAPLVGAALGRVGAGLSAIGGAKALGPLALLAGGGALAYGYATDTGGTTGTNTAVNQFFKAASELFNYGLPGNPFNTQKYDTQMQMNSVGDALLSIFGGPGGIDAAVTRANTALNNPAFQYAVDPMTGKTNVFNYDEEDLKKYVAIAAEKAGVTVGEYLLSSAQSSSLVLDPVTGTYKSAAELKAAALFRNTGSNTVGTTSMNYGGLAPLVTPRYYGDIGSSVYNGPYQPAATTPYGGATGTPTYIGPAGQTSGPFSGTGVSGLTSGGVDVSGGLATSIADAIKKQSDAYYGLADASEVAQRGLSQFKAVQDSILGQQGIYTDQLSEFTQEVNLQQNAYDILNKRREEGQKLTKSDIEFLDNFAEANERGTGAQEDAAIAAGKIAQAYLLNMEIGDQLNQSVSDTTGAVGDLVDIIEELILSMENVPPSVRTRIELERAEEAGAALSTIVGLLNALDGRTTTFYVNVEGNGVSLGRPNGVGPTADLAMNGITAYANGGTAYDPLMPRFANGGTYALVGEVGPELVKLSRGDQVTPTGASRSMMRRSGGDQFHFNAPVTVVAPTPRQFTDRIREESMGSSRL